MRTHILNPKILLLGASIEYQRVENKFSSLEPQILQVGIGVDFSLFALVVTLVTSRPSTSLCALLSEKEVVVFTFRANFKCC